LLLSLVVVGQVSELTIAGQVRVQGEVVVEPVVLVL